VDVKTFEVNTKLAPVNVGTPGQIIEGSYPVAKFSIVYVVGINSHTAAKNYISGLALLTIGERRNNLNWSVSKLRVIYLVET
jgi:hypothetical protein